MLTSTSSKTARIPAEWEPHAASIVAWPGRPSVWGDHLGQGQSETLHLIQRIAETEPVLVVVSPPDHSQLATTVADARNMTLIDIPLDDCWSRDISPIFTVNAENGKLTAVDFEFNSWGGKFLPYDNDASFGLRISRELGVERISVPLVMEGGSLTTDGCGTAVIVEQTILNDNRNPNKGKSEVEAVLNAYLGIEKVIWLPFGLLDDTDTDGHVDNVIMFCGQQRIMVQMPPSPDHPDAQRLKANFEILRRARNSRGAQLEIIEIPWLPVSNLDPSRPSSYLNVYCTSSNVLVPVTGTFSDDFALTLVSEAFGGKHSIPIPSNALSYGGGGPHCMTMQIPAHNGKLEMKGYKK